METVAGSGFIYSAIEKGRAVHAAIITGGDNAQCVARAKGEACALVCRGEKPPCGVCPQCIKAERNVHPDIICVEAEKDKKEIQVEQIRRMRKEAYIVPNEAEKKVFIICGAGSMNAAAQNALLKILEEPPGYAVFLLAEEEPGLLLPTVRSRCWNISFAGKEQEREENALAAEYVSLLKDKNVLALAEFCVKLEKGEKKEAAAFLSCAAAEIGKELRSASENGENISVLMAAAELLPELRRMADFNVSIGHISGKLLSESAAAFSK